MPNQRRNITALPDATYRAGTNAPAFKNTETDILSGVAEMLVPDVSPMRRMAHDFGTLLGVNSDRFQMTGGDAVALAMAAIPLGRGKVPKKQAVELTHYSAQPRNVLKSSFQGTSSVASQELAAGIPKNKAINFYNEVLGPPEKIVTSVSPFKHTIKGKFAVLDIASPEGIAILRKATESAAKKSDGNPLSELNAIVKKAGYDLYHNSEFYPNNYRFVRDKLAVPSGNITNMRRNN
jgi:hypothetical protein